MYQRFAVLTMGIALTGMLGTTPSWAGPGPAPQAQQESPYKDQGEYQLASDAQKETDATKKLAIIDQWEQKYPDSKLKGNRTLMKAQALLGGCLAAYGRPANDPSLEPGKKTCATLVDNLGTLFAADMKPAQATDDQWKAAAKQAEEQARSSYGYIAMMQKDDATAETQFKKVLDIDPGAAQVAYWAGTVVIRQRKLERYPEGLYLIAHAVAVTGPGALPAQAKTAAENYLTKAYAGFHGDNSGLDDLKAKAAGSAMMPADLKIKSITEIEQEKAGSEAEFAKQYPDRAFLRTLKGGLVDKGDEYFANLKDVAIPPPTMPEGIPQFTMFKGKVVTQNSQKELVVAVDNQAGDITLNFDENPFKGTINPGTEIEFKGVVQAYTKEPFGLTLLIQDPKDDVKGMPAEAFGVTKKAAPKAPAKKAPAAAKKQ